jgi:SAM-dependent methyltransferase
LRFIALATPSRGKWTQTGNRFIRIVSSVRPKSHNFATMNEFDQWRAGYGTRTIGEEIAYHNELEARFPEQAHFNPMAAHTAFYTVWPSKVLEAGAWKGHLAKEILDTEPEVKKWVAYEISTAAITKTVCSYPEFSYTIPDRFDWFTSPHHFERFDMFVATHFIEHISDEHFKGMAAAINAAKVPALYFEAPINDTPTQWDGYQGTHMLNMGWAAIKMLLPEYEMRTIAPGCKLFIRQA